MNATVKQLQDLIDKAQKEVMLLQSGVPQQHSFDFLQGRMSGLSTAIRYIEHNDKK